MPISNRIPTPRGEHLVAPLRAVLYARTSRDHKKRATSTRDQMEMNRRQCSYNKWEVVKEFVDDDASASAKARKARDDYEAMLQLVIDGGCDVIVACETSRLLRTLDTYLELRRACRKMGVLWCVGGSIYDLSNRNDARATALDAVQAEDEAVGIGIRNNRTVALNAERGRPHGRILYGYKRRYDPDTGDLIEQVPHPQESKVVREIFKRLAAGNSAYSIAKDLDQRGLRPPDRKRWDSARMVEIGKNPSYMGKRVYRGQVIGEATWKPLVSEKTFRAVQRVLGDPTRRTMPDTIVRHLLTGIARCGVCDCHCPLRVLPNRGILAYICKGCFCTSMVELKLDAYVELALQTWLAKPEAREILRVSPSDTTAFDSALAELEDLEKQLAEGRRAAASPDPRTRLSVTSLMAMEAGLQPEIDAKREEVKRLAPRAPLPEVEDLLGADDVAERWKGKGMEEKRVVLRAVADIQLFKGRKGSPEILPGRIVVKFGPQAKLSPMARVK